MPSSLKTRLRLLLCAILFAAPAFPVAIAQQATAPAGIHWISSTSANPWVELPFELSTDPAPSGPIELDGSKTFQTIDGFGSCFNELGWFAIQRLDPPARERLLQALFAPDGANFSLGRVGIGANDFATSWYSFDETPNDYDLKNFSIDRDRQAILPFIHAAMRYQPNLGIWAVPWSPPTWMKTNGAYKGGEMKDDPKIYASYALYFSKYISAMRAEGIHLYAVMPQNEPRYNNNIYPQAVWTGRQMNIFLRDYLVPQINRDHLAIQVWQGTIVNDNLAPFILPVLDDPVTDPNITGVAYQYAGQKAMLETHNRFPDKKMMQSETECNNGENSWGQGLNTFRNIIRDTNHFAGSYFYWNTVLNDDAKSTWGWRQNSLITVDRKSGEARFNPDFYALKHFSAAVLPGSHRIAVSGGGFTEVVAFRNPSGQFVVEFENDLKSAIKTTFKFQGKLFTLTVPAESMNTITASQ